MKQIWIFTISICFGLLACKTGQMASSSNVPDDFMLSIERTPCMGTCPQYVMSIDANGKVRYDGRNFVDHKGSYQKQLAPETMNTIAEVLNAGDYWSFKAKYDEPQIMDLPSTIVSCTMDGKTHKVVNRANAPQEFEYLIKLVEAIIGTDGLQEVKN